MAFCYSCFLLETFEEPLISVKFYEGVVLFKKALKIKPNRSTYMHKRVPLKAFMSVLKG